jgi:hypothetical protein
LGNQNSLVGIRLLPNTGELRVVILDHPGFGQIDMPDIDCIRVQGNRLVRMYLGNVKVPVAAMRVCTSQVGMWRRPLHRQENGQQNEIGRGTNVVLDQENEHSVKSACIVS